MLTKQTNKHASKQTELELVLCHFFE